MIKVTYRIPTKEPFAFIEMTQETNETDPSDIKSTYEALTNEFKEGGAGIPTVQFNALLDEYLTTRGIKNGGDTWENMSKEQQAVFQEIKKSRKRTNK